MTNLWPRPVQRHLDIWFPKDGPQSLTPFKKIMFDETGPRWKPPAFPLMLTSILTKDEDGLSCAECLIEFELPDKITLEVHYERWAAEEIFSDIEIVDVDFATNLLNDVVGFDYVRNPEETIDLVHEARKAVRIKCAELMENYGICVVMVASKLRWTYWQRYDADYLHVISLSMLGDDLRPTTFDIKVPLRSDHNRKLERLFATLPETHRRAVALQSQGADGSIDMLALNVIKAKGSVEEELRNFACLKTDTRFSMTNGNMYLHGVISAKPRTFVNGSYLKLHNTSLPESARLAGIGKPVTKLISCDLLSPEMTIVGMENQSDGRGDCLGIQFDQPVFYFCSLSGRYWR